MAWPGAALCMILPMTVYSVVFLFLVMRMTTAAGWEPQQGRRRYDYSDVEV